ncbi:hypothetical protein [Actinomadura sp. 7K534]|uniref:hypothetical protein n=1 Tax=Actinomadura sp. 7K534 TaxID=2530366 RepID=UPI001047A93E|nr:hypothetical protein [Actinomadura sp. 7K534]TDB85163.1 hypothetical protein E1266_35910 [Actinomadura sp. 7K534]
MRPRPVLRIAAAALLCTGLVAGPSTAAAAEPAPLQPAATPWLWPRSGLEAVSATGPDDVWAVGYQGYQAIDYSIPGWPNGTVQILPPKAAVVRWNGSSWRTYDLPGTGGDAMLREIDARSPSDVWVLGTLHPNQRPVTYLAHWDGTRWEQVETLTDERAPRTPAGDSTGAWFGCGNDLCRWQDGEWTIQETGRPPDACCVEVSEISVLSDDDAWAAAHWGLLHWDGRTWSKLPGSGEHRWLRVLAVSADEVWASGIRLTSPTGSERFLVRWDGHVWHEEPPPPGDLSLIKTGDGTMWGVERHQGGVHRLDGSSWTEVTVPKPDDGRISGGTAVPGSPALWLVGKTPNIPVVINNNH